MPRMVFFYRIWSDLHNCWRRTSPYTTSNCSGTASGVREMLCVPGGAIATRRAESTRKCRKRAAVHNYFCSIIFVLYWKRNKCTDDLYHEDKKELIGGQITKNKNKNKKNQQAPLFGTPFLELMVYNGSNREDSHVVPLFKQDNHAATEMYSFWTTPFPTQNDPQLTLRTGRSSPSTKHSIAVLLKSDRAKSPAELPGSRAAHRDTAPTSAVRDLWDINSQPSVGCSCLVSQLCWRSEHFLRLVYSVLR